MKIVFVYSGPHPVHKEFAKSVTNEFYCSYTNKMFRLPILKNIDALIRSFFLKKAEVYLCEGGTDLLTAFPKKMVNKNVEIIALVASSYGIIGVTNPLSKIIMKHLLNKCDGVIAVSDYIKDELKKEGIKIPIKVVNPFLDYERFSKISANLTNNNFLYIGRNHPERNIKNLINVFRILSCKLTIVGNGFYEKKDENIEFHGPTKNIEMYLANHTFFIDLSLFAPYPVAVLEAMASGCIPIVSKNCGNKELLEKNGLRELIIYEDDPKEIAKKIEKLVRKDIKWRENVSKKVKIIAKEKNKERQVLQFKKTIKEFLK
jgi:glycosyltransferase involved in cell wall biosynthesis